MTTKLQRTARIAAVGLAMTFGSMAITPTIAAQDAPDAVVEEEDDGFDWGWLGLLGLAGLAGLKSKEPEVIHRDSTRNTTR